MDAIEKHQREMNIGSHIVWAAAMWASGTSGYERENYLAASIGFYYCVYHIGFARINTEHSFHLEDMQNIKHSKVEKWLEDHLSFRESIDYKLLRFVRENVNYLGMESPRGKLSVVRGHPFGYKFENQKISFDEMLQRCHKSSKGIFLLLLGQIEKFCKQESWQPLQLGREYYINEYLGEDLLHGILPNDNEGNEIRRKLILLILDEDKNYI